MADTTQTESKSDLLPFRWENAEGILEKKDDFLPLLEAYKEASGDRFDVYELLAELVATIREGYGAVFAALDDERRLAGYMCMRVVDTGAGTHAFITQWYQRHGNRDLAVGITDAFFASVKQMAAEFKCDRIKIETRRVRDDGAAPRAYMKLLEKFGFRPAYAGLEVTLDHAA